MPKTLTLKNIPDALYERLKAAAVVNRRSLNSEAIVCLESVLLQTRLASGERLVRARELRAALAPAKFCAREINALKQAGRVLEAKDAKLLRAFPTRCATLPAVRAGDSKPGPKVS